MVRTISSSFWIARQRVVGLWLETYSPNVKYKNKLYFALCVSVEPIRVPPETKSDQNRITMTCHDLSKSVLYINAQILLSYTAVDCSQLSFLVILFNGWTLGQNREWSGREFKRKTRLGRGWGLERLWTVYLTAAIETSKVQTVLQTKKKKNQKLLFSKGK